MTSGLASATGFGEATQSGAEIERYVAVPVNRFLTSNSRKNLTFVETGISPTWNV